MDNDEGNDSNDRATVIGGSKRNGGRAAKLTDPEIKADLLRRYREGMQLRQLSRWLQETHGIELHYSRLSRILQKIKAARADMEHDPPPRAGQAGPLLADDLGDVDEEDEQAQLKRDVMLEYRRAQQDPDEWKRVQGALRLRLALYSANKPTAPAPDDAAKPTGFVLPTIGAKPAQDN